MADVFVGLGSNIEPESNLPSAVARLGRELGALELSPVYRSPALGFEGPDFLNLVARIATPLGPAAVEALLSEIERAGGRGHAERRGSRTLDLDLLIHGECVDALLRLPRDDVLRYPFVLKPLTDLAPGLRHPVTGVRMADAWKEMESTGPELVRLGSLERIGG